MIDVMLQKLTEPETLQAITGAFMLLLYVTGRITKAQFIAEQLKAQGKILPANAKETAVENITKPVTVIFDVMNMIPVVNTKLPVLNMSIPDIAKFILQVPAGVASDALFMLGNGVKK